jgi:hypothetical protein
MLLRIRSAAILALLAGSLAMASPTPIQDTLYTPTGGTANGSINLKWPTFYSSPDGHLVQGGSLNYTVTNGVINLLLEPTDTSVPAGVTYTATYNINGAPSIRENWLVPTSATPVNLKAIRVLNPPTPGPYVPNVTVINGLPVFLTTVYNWPAQTPGVGLTANIAATVKVAPCPAALPALAAANNYYVWINDGSNSEGVLVTGGTCVSSGTTGTFTFTPRYSHGSSWTLNPASGGWQEAIWAATNSSTHGGIVSLPPATITLHGPVYMPPAISGWGPWITNQGAGRDVTVVRTDLDTANPTQTLWMAYTCGSGGNLACLQMTSSIENSTTALNVTGAANNGSGVIRLTFSGGITYQDEDLVWVQNVGGTTEANGYWHVKVISSTQIDLEGSTFTHAYTSGGTGTRILQAQILVDPRSGNAAFRDMMILTPQPLHPASIADIIQMPTTIYNRGGQLDMDHVLMPQCWQCIDVGGIWSGTAYAFNGFSRIVDVDLSAWRHGIQSDGSIVLQVRGVNFWPWIAMPSDAIAVWNADPNIYAIWTGHAEDLTVSDTLFQNHTADLHRGLDGQSTWGQFTGCAFDGFTNPMNISGGLWVEISGSYFTPATSTPALAVSGAATSVTLSSVQFLDYGSPQPFISLASGATLAISATQFKRNAVNCPDAGHPCNTNVVSDVQVTGSGTALSLTGNTFVRDGTLAWTNPFIDCQSGALCTVTGNTAIPATTGSGVFVKIAADNYHVIQNNSVGGWSFTAPVPSGKGLYQLSTSGTQVIGASDETVTLTTGTFTLYPQGRSNLDCNAVGGSITLNLPTAASSGGTVYVFTKTDSSGNACIFHPNGTDLINGVNANKSTATQYNALRIHSNGTSWFATTSTP